MADQVIINKNVLTDIGNAIRNKKGTTDLIPATSMASEIESIETGSVGDLVGYTGSVSFQTTISGSRHSYILIKPDLTMEKYYGTGNASYTISTPVIAVCCCYSAKLSALHITPYGTAGYYEVYGIDNNGVIGVFIPTIDNFAIYCNDDD